MAGNRELSSASPVRWLPYTGSGRHWSGHFNKRSTMMSKHQRIPYAKNLTPKSSLTKEYLDHLAQLERQDLEASRVKTRASPPTVQMSIRM